MVMLGEYSSLAFVLPAATVIGWGAGYLLDRAFHTSFLYMVFLILGIAAGFVQLIRTVTRKPHGD
jgi:F0F1-type ATP synthase assembly protein I